MNAPMRIAALPSKNTSEFSTYRYLRRHEAKDLHQIAFKFVVNPADDTIAFSFAMCSPNDNFDFAFVRAMLEQRFKEEDAVFYFSGAYFEEDSLVQNAVDAVQSRLHRLKMTQSGMKSKRSKAYKATEKSIATYLLFLETARVISIYRELDFVFKQNTPMMGFIKWLFGRKAPALRVDDVK